jgi:hypothetical protein
MSKSKTHPQPQTLASETLPAASAPDAQALYGNSFVRQMGGAGPLWDPALGVSMAGATGGMGLLDVIEGMELGDSGGSDVMSVLSGMATMFTHDATQEEGTAAWAERIGMGLVDIFGITDGPVSSRQARPP